MGTAMLLCYCLAATMSLLAVRGADDRVDYTGHRVISFAPETKQQLEKLREMRIKEEEMDFWTEPRGVGFPVHIRLSPSIQKKFPTFFESLGYSGYRVMIEDVQEAIEAERAENEAAAYASTTPLGRYARLGDIHSWLDSLATKFPSLVSTFVVGKTYEGRDIKGVRIGETADRTKKVVWIHAGIHAREWIAPAAAVYFIDHLLTSYSTDAAVKKLVDDVAWYIVPVANPDGYEYSHEVDRLWRKTRTPSRGSSCHGADPNRNWDDHFGGQGTSSSSCSDIYTGPHAFSEPCTKALSDYILSLSQRTKVFFSFHSYSQMWLTSWGWTDRQNPIDHVDIQRVAKIGTVALEARHGKDYEYGAGGSILYPAAGAEDDWAKAKAGIKYSFTLELRPGPYAWNGFILPKRQIIPTGEEVWTGVKAVVENVYFGK